MQRNLAAALTSGDSAIALPFLVQSLTLTAWLSIDARSRRLFLPALLSSFLLPPRNQPMLAIQRATFLLAFIALSGCEQSTAPSTPQSAGVPVPAAATTQIAASTYPSFKIDVQLTPAAQEQLNQSGDRIGVSFEFATERGPEPLLSHQVELAAPGLIDTNSFSFTPEAVAKLGSEFEVQVNGYSISSTNLNVLHCQIVAEYFSSLRDQTRVLACDLLKLD